MTPHHHRRTASAVSTDAEIIRLIELWRSRGLKFSEISERLGEKGHRISSERARKLLAGGALKVRA